MISLTPFHSVHNVIYVVRGSITWVLPELRREIEKRAGNHLALPILAFNNASPKCVSWRTFPFQLTLNHSSTNSLSSFVHSLFLVTIAMTNCSPSGDHCGNIL
jgi:hypothetical protein